MTLIRSKDSHVPADAGSTLSAPHAASAVAAAEAALTGGLDTLDVLLDRHRRTVWGFMRPGDGVACVRPDLLRDLRSMHAAVRQLHEATLRAGGDTVQYVVLASRIPGIFNLGGDLALFADKIRSGDRPAMSRYAHACIDVVHSNSIAFGLPVVTVGLVQGDALGGGFECALSHDVLIAERSARMGLPEILFNLFPGMGAYSFLSRRLDAMRAEKMILSGRIYTASELHEIGIVDVLAEDGEGEAAACDYIERNARKHNAQAAVFRARRRVRPITEGELRDVVDIWVEAALGLTAADLRKMERLAAAQRRRLEGVAPARTAALAAPPIGTPACA